MAGMTLLLAPVALFGQLSLVEHVIDSNAHGAASLHACDLDRDNDNDAIAACSAYLGRSRT
jgi:hypothetical protein